MKSTKENIRIKIVSPLVIMLLISCGIFALGGYKIQEKHLTAEIEAKTLEVDKLFARLLKNETKFMTAQLQFIMSDPVLIDAWQSRNRTELFDRASSIFQKINSSFNVSHFYFIEPDRTCFLRVHAPGNFGDEITRLTLKKAVANSEISSGIELGSLGTFTLRVVYPWIINGRLLGYLELGEEIEHLTPRLKEISGLEQILTVDKSNLIRENWEKGLHSLHKKGHWDEFAKFVVIDKTISSLPPELKTIVQQNHSRTNSQNISLNNRLLSIYAHPLQDFSGRQVGTHLTILDITNKATETRKAIITLVIVVLIVYLLILLFYYRYSGKIEQQVDAYQDNLEVLVNERTRELHIALDEVKILSGFLPICASCKQIRDDKGYWNKIESYISEHSEAEFSHSICPGCATKLYPDLVDEDGNFKE